jgi:acetyl-CoA acetyltransferase
MKALQAQADGRFDKQIVPITVNKHSLTKREKKNHHTL